MRILFFFQRAITSEIAIIGLELPDDLPKREKMGRVGDFIATNSSQNYVYLGACEQIHGESLDGPTLMRKARPAFRPEEPDAGYFAAALYPGK